MNTFLKIGLCVSALTAASPCGAEELGRLFFTPQQRALLDSGKQPDLDQRGNVDSLTINGIVQKHGGERTIWINGVPKRAGKSDERSPESTTVVVPGRSRPVKVKVGQKLLLETPQQPRAAEQKPAENKPPRASNDDDD